jgi:hypothetical protein
MNTEPEKEFIERARATLDSSTQALDEITVARLRAARKRALDVRPQRFSRRTAGWIAAGVTAGLAAFLLVHSPALTPPRLEQIEWVAEAEIDLAQEPEFYLWLADGKRTI